MVRKIKVSSVYDVEPEANEPTSDDTNAEQANEHDNQQVEPITETREAKTDEQPNEQPNEQPTEKPAKKPMLDMPTTPKILQQVECQACKRKMSAKTLKYNHANYCTERGREAKPENIPIPKMEIKNGEQLKNKTSLPVKRPTLKRSKPIAREEAEAEPEKPAPSTPALPMQTPQMDESFHYKMRQRTQQKEAQYQVMMSNAF
jgi:hypothetical protein